MKKVFSYVLLGLGAFFIFSMQSFAKEEITINYDVNEYFNFFYEQKNNTPMFQLIISQGNEFPEYLIRLGSLSSGFDFNIWAQSCSNNTCSDYPNAKYRFILGRTRSYLKYSNGKYSFQVESNNAASNVIDILYFDENAEFLGDKVYRNVTFNSFPNSIDNDNFQYIISAFIYHSNLLKSDITCSNCMSMRTNKLKVDGHYVTFDADINSWFVNFSKKFTHTILGFDKSTLSAYGLEYFNKNYYYDTKKGYVPSLLDILYYDQSKQSLTVPTSYSSSSFSYDDRYFLVPNSKTCTDKDKLLYLNSSDTSSVHFINYSLLQDNSLSSDIGTYSYKIKKANTVYALSLKTIIPAESNINDYVYYIFSSNNFSSNVIYYNPLCFDLYNAVNSEDLTFTNINTDSSITLTPNDQKIFYNDNSDLVERIVKESENQSPNVDIKSIIAGAWDGAKSIVSSSYYLMDLTTGLFERLPSEVSSLLVICFTVSVIIVLWKVFRG